MVLEVFVTNRIVNEISSRIKSLKTLLLYGLDYRTSIQSTLSVHFTYICRTACQFKDIIIWIDIFEAKCDKFRYCQRISDVEIYSTQF